MSPVEDNKVLSSKGLKEDFFLCGKWYFKANVQIFPPE